MTQPNNGVVVNVPAEDIAMLRTMIGETAYTDQQLAEILALDMLDDGHADLDAAAELIWRRKAGELADLTDIDESGSKRALSKLYKNALDVAEMYRGRRASRLEATLVLSTGRARTRPIRRA